jgi:superfamily II DNA/RNA helicase
MGIKSNPGLQRWFTDNEAQIRTTFAQLYDEENDFSVEERRALEEKLKRLQTVARERTGAFKHNVVLSYLMHCRQKTVVFGWHRDMIQDLAFKLRQAGRDVVTLIGSTRQPEKAERTAAFNIFL